MSSRSRLIWVDVLRLSAGLSMVGLHATSDSYGLPWVEYDPVERIAPIALRSILYIARTELFIIISAFLLILAIERRPRNYSTIVCEQSSRLLIPYIFWTVFYAFFNLCKAFELGYLHSSIGELTELSTWVRFFLLGDVKYHMHFIPTLLGVLLFYPFFRVASDYPLLGFLVLICLAVRHEIDSFLYERFWGDEILPWVIRMVKVLAYVGYGFVAAATYGILKRTEACVVRKWSVPLIYLCCVALCVKIVAAWKTIETAEWPFDFVAGYWADFLSPVLLFMLLASISWKINADSISSFARFSFGIYLCHPVFLDGAEIFLLGVEVPPIIQVFCKIVVAVPASFLFVYSLSKVAALSWIVGLGDFPKIVETKRWVG